jgi:hypothetical protein
MENKYICQHIVQVWGGRKWLDLSTWPTASQAEKVLDACESNNDRRREYRTIQRRWDAADESPAIMEAAQ